MSERAASAKSADAYRTISEVAEDLGLPQHVLRFWETRFPQVKPLKRAGGRRFYRPEDVDLLRAVQALLYGDGYTIKGVQRMLRDQGPKAIAALTATPSMVPRDGIESVPTAVDAAPGTSASGPTRPSKPDGPADVPADEPVAERDGRFADAASSFESPTRLSRHVGSGIIGRLQAVLFDLAECERLISPDQNPSFDA